MVQNSVYLFNTQSITALSLAMARDGSSGGIIRLAIITESGVVRKEVLGDELPTFWQG